MLLDYLQEFKLQRCLTLTANLRKFTTHGVEMRLNASTITNLEIFRNSSDSSARGSLLWVLDHTVTPFGRRQLREWVSHPLVDTEYVVDLEFLLYIISQIPEVFENHRSSLHLCSDRFWRGWKRWRNCETRRFLSLKI